jgi:curli production assembly/transport component CsgG
VTRSIPSKFTPLLAACLLGGCAAGKVQPVAPTTPAVATPRSAAARDLTRLPPPKGRITVAVYNLRDQTGQYKPSPDSSFSTAVTQGGAAFLIRALSESGWFSPVEREGLQNLLTERRIVRSIESPSDKGSPAVQLPPLTPASVLIEGGIVGYEADVRTGGAGVAYLGVSASTQYRTDQVTVMLRAIDVRTGAVLVSASTTKTVLSYQLQSGVFRYVSFKKLLEAEAGYTRNEPIQLCVNEAIEAAVIQMIGRGLQSGIWAGANGGAAEDPVFQHYLSTIEETGEAPARAVEFATGGKEAASP